ncbi:Mrp/NBP35 family ATP-binding protein [Arcanobacterium canis]
MSIPSVETITQALATVNDPEIRRPITELNMVSSVDIDDAGSATIGIKLTVAGCPLRDTLTADIERAVGALEGITNVKVVMGVMTEEEREALKTELRGGNPAPRIPFSEPGNLTRVYAITSGKGGVGKSTVTVNLASAMAAQGLKVGVMDADIYGFSVPQMLGVDTKPTMVNKMIIPPVSGDIKVMSIGMFIEENQPIVWRGPMLHRALEQFLADVYWGDLDVLLIDLPPGTGDIALSLAQLIPNAQIVLVTTPQVAAAEVAERSGIMAAQTKQRVVGVIENMSYLDMGGTRMEIFGSGGGEAVAKRLKDVLGYDVPLLAQVPLEQEVREGGDAGVPYAGAAGESAAQRELRAAASTLAQRTRSLAGVQLGVSPL